jgi:hypothetical protein
MKRSLAALCVLMICCSFYFINSTPVEVADSTLKIGGLGEEVFYYGFAEGDQIVFSFEEVNGKELKEVEISEWPSNSKFMDYKTKKIENKMITVTRTGIYKFRFSNSAIGGRVCKFRIERIPGNEANQNFNTAVYWKTLYDTTYTPVQERYLIKSDTAATMLTDQVAKVSSTNAINGNTNKTIVDVTLPEGTISWSYYIGTGSEGKKAYDDAKSKCLTASAGAAAKIPGYGPMVALALYGTNYFNKVQGEDNVKYYFITNWDNVQLFEAGGTFYQYKLGDVVNDASQMKSPLSGKLYLGLENDNVMDPIDVTVKINAISVTQQWGMRTLQKMSVSSREEPFLKN